MESEGGLEEGPAYRFFLWLYFAMIKLAHGMTLVIYFYFIMQLLSMFVLVHNSFEYFNL